ncbi:zinc ribbon domain-containing protein [Weissella diestrammenae]|uniref:Zinc ribbon domain-containing protein n=1 Tax=Weissella diestrammenae TaxID=1162633 RepID=A0A7G9T4L4_9LACO|nr:zinc ribbon domain-containing protein [Weissella diestrammenae]MCM0582064.1 zinc ribbon domain-containing protein [Weissella diestrammenae]QNN75039.1 zinc ribbon domain-containing protein [Weissella diestrammenae]
MEKFCQSCAMPLTTDNRGTNQDGTLSNTYCHYCFQDGQFTQPDLSFEEMLVIGKKGLDANEMSAIKKFILKASYPMMLKKVSRFK